MLKSLHSERLTKANLWQWTLYGLLGKRLLLESVRHRWSNIAAT